MKRSTRCALALFGAIALSTTTSAQTLSGIGPGGGDPVKTFHEISATAPVFEVFGGPFYFDRGGGPWIKNLVAPSNGWQPGQIYIIHETFTFLPPPTGLPPVKITDWHERIDFGPDGLIWDIWVGQPMFMVDNETPSGLMTMINDARTEVWFFFDPINVGPNGVTFSIWKEFQFIGDVPMTLPVSIIEYPTPTPGAAALFALAGVTLGRRRR